MEAPRRRCGCRRGWNRGIHGDGHGRSAVPVASGGLDAAGGRVDHGAGGGVTVTISGAPIGPSASLHPHCTDNVTGSSP